MSSTQGRLSLFGRCQGSGCKAFGKAIDSLAKSDWIAIGEGVIWVKKALENNPFFSLDHEKQRKSIEEIIKSAPKSAILLQYCDLYGIERPFNLPLAEPPESLSPSYAKPNTKSNSNSESESKYIDNGSAIPYQEIIDHLNNVTGQNFQNVKAWREKIRARWQEFESDVDDGEKLREFMKIHESRAMVWKADPKMAQYLRPKTLYAKENFWNYFGQAESILRDKKGDPF